MNSRAQIDAAFAALEQNCRRGDDIVAAVRFVDAAQAQALRAELVALNVEHDLLLDRFAATLTGKSPDA